MTKPLFPYQEQAAALMATRDRFGLHDEMGIGKTATTIRALDLAGARRGMVICPAHLRANWQKEFRMFSTMQRSLCLGRNIHDFVSWSRGRFDVLITSYELATKWAKSFRDLGEILDFVAIDEAHYLKNTASDRTEAILGKATVFNKPGWPGIVDYALRVYHITGTPMANDPMDIYTFLKFCWATDMTPRAFSKRFFIGRASQFDTRHFPIDAMVPELRELILNNSIRRTKKDVGIQLPPIWLTTMEVSGETAKIEHLLAEYPDLEDAIMTALRMGGLQFLMAEHIATLRRLIGESKVIPYGQVLIEELLTTTDKRVVFGIHKDALARLRFTLTNAGMRSVIINGEISHAEREKAVHEFQTDPNCRVLIGNMRAAGTGYTLTAACEIDVLESSWAPADNAQAIMRVHRIGQERHVHARFIGLSDSFDTRVTEVVAEKTAAIAQIEGHAMVAAPDQSSRPVDGFRMAM